MKAVVNQSRFIRILSLLLMISLSCKLAGQFEQQFSLNLSTGYFNTLGPSDYQKAGASPDTREPTLMPNFKGGMSFSAGLQYNFNRHFSIEVHLGSMTPFGWYYDIFPEPWKSFSFLYYEIRDPVSGELLTEGTNNLQLFTSQIGLSPRYYFLSGKKFNPFLLAGLTLNYTGVFFGNDEYYAYRAYDLLDEYNGNEELNNWFTQQVSPGIRTGAGVEFVITDNIGFFTLVSYEFVPLYKSSFFNEEKHADLHTVHLHLGARFSILKSKVL